MKKQQFDKTEFVHVDHPTFAVHNFHSLARATGYSATGLANMYANGVFPMLATNFGKAKNSFAIDKRVVTMLIERKRNSVIKRYGSR
jgi:hypothetical protein